MKGFLSGLGVGVALGLLFAPASGKQTRRRIRREASNLAEMPRRKMREAVNSGRTKAGELGREAGERAYDEVVKKAGGENYVSR